MPANPTNQELAQQVAALREIVVTLARDTKQRNAEGSTKGPEHETPGAWIALKKAVRGRYSYEAVRSWAERGLIEARKEGGRWRVTQASIDARLAWLAQLRGNNAHPLVFILRPSRW